MIHRTVEGVRWQSPGVIWISTTDLDLALATCHTSFASAWNIDHGYTVAYGT
jgi:hypothetical protein